MGRKYFGRSMLACFFAPDRGFEFNFFTSKHEVSNKTNKHNSPVRLDFENYWILSLYFFSKIQRKLQVLVWSSPKCNFRKGFIPFNCCYANVRARQKENDDSTLKSLSSFSKFKGCHFSPSIAGIFWGTTACCHLRPLEYYPGKDCVQLVNICRL